MEDLQINKFLDSLFDNLAEIGMDVSHYPLDHVAYYFATSGEYDERKDDFLKLGTEIKESLVGGRRVSIIKLNQALQYKQYSIDGFELIEPKPEQEIVSGLEHAEFVVEDLKALVESYPSIKWDLSAIDRDEYPKVQFRFADGVGVKFHPLHIFEEALN